MITGLGLSARLSEVRARGSHDLSWAGLAAPRGHDISWLMLRWRFARFRAFSCGCEEYWDGGSEFSLRRADLL